MRNSRNPDRWRAALGVLLLGGIAAAVLGFFLSGGAAREAAGKVIDFTLSSPPAIFVTLPEGSGLRSGDPVYVEDDEAFLLPVGRIEEVGEDGARLLVYPEHLDLLRAGLRADLYEVPDTVAWIVNTLIPPGKAMEIQAMAGEFLAREGTVIGETLRPEIDRALKDVVALYREDLPEAFARHRPEIDRIAARHREGVVKAELMPVIREVGGALAAQKFGPMADELGRELLKELPVWSLGFKYIAEKLPFTREEQVKRRFEKYLEEKAGPILEAHSDEAVRLAGEVARGLLADPRVREAAMDAARTVAADPEVAALVKTLFEELVLQNDRLVQTLKRRWDEGMKEAVASAAARIEPLVKRITDSIVLDGDRRSLSPRFSHVLRTRVFWKDRRFVLLSAGNGSPLPPGARIAGTRPGD